MDKKQPWIRNDFQYTSIGFVKIEKLNLMKVIRKLTCVKIIKLIATWMLIILKVKTSYVIASFFEAASFYAMYYKFRKNDKDRFLMSGMYIASAIIIEHVIPVEIATIKTNLHIFSKEAQLQVQSIIKDQMQVIINCVFSIATKYFFYRKLNDSMDFLFAYD
jgi:hypothetical protein